MQTPDKTIPDDATDAAERAAVDLWHLGGIGAHPEDDGRKIFGANVRAAHEEGAFGAGATVAIIDSGADHEHPNLAAAIPEGHRWSFEPYDDGVGRVADDRDILNRYDAHGTALAGVVAGRPADTPNGKSGAAVTAAHREFVGVAPGAALRVIRLFTNFQPGQFQKALAVAAEADVILLARTLPQVRKTWARPNLEPANPERDSAFAMVQQELAEIARSVPVVCAAGNGGFNALSFPASLPETIAVGALNEFGWRSTYSQFADGLDIVAPSSDAELASRNRQLLRLTLETAERRGLKTDGTTDDERESELNTRRLGMRGIATTDNRGSFGYVLNAGADGHFVPATGPARFGGTSAASAIVAGVVALLIGANPALRGRPETVRAILRTTAVMPTPDGKSKGSVSEGADPELGWGLVDAAAAVAAARAWEEDETV